MPALVSASRRGRNGARAHMCACGRNCERTRTLQFSHPQCCWRRLCEGGVGAGVACQNSQHAGRQAGRRRAHDGDSLQTRTCSIVRRCPAASQPVSQPASQPSQPVRRQSACQSACLPSCRLACFRPAVCLPASRSPATTAAAPPLPVASRAAAACTPSLADAASAPCAAFAACATAAVASRAVK